MKKKLLLVLMLITALVVMPRVSAEEAVRATVTDITNSDTLTSTAHQNQLTPDENGNYTITYDNDTFKLIEGKTDSDDNRPADKAWIGFRVTLPSNGAKKYEIKQSDTDLVTKTEIPEDDKNVDVYYGFDADKLKAASADGKKLEASFVLNLYSETEETLVATQKITIVINPKGITLKSKDNSETEVWNETIYNENIKKVNVTVKAMKDGKEVKLDEPLSYELKEVYVLTEEQVTEIESVLADENLELVGLYTDVDLKNEFDPEAELTENTIIYVVYKTKVAEEEAPETLDNATMYIALAGASILVASGVAVYYKRFN